jgi:hypothetical protein
MMQRVSSLPFDLRLRAHRCWMVKKAVALRLRRTNPITVHSLTRGCGSTPPLQHHFALCVLDVGQETLLTVITYPPWQNHPFHFRQVYSNQDSDSLTTHTRSLSVNASLIIYCMPLRALNNTVIPPNATVIANGRLDNLLRGPKCPTDSNVEVSKRQTSKLTFTGGPVHRLLS